MSRRGELRALVGRRDAVVVPGAYDCLSAKFVEQAGFPAVYASGYGASASRLGLPDLGFLGLTDMADQARGIATVVRIPVIADADTGYGNELQVRRTVELYEAAGVAALHVEDQTMPKRCGHLTGHDLVSVVEFAAKIRAAAGARTDPDLLVIARTDAISAAGIEEALRRGEAALAAGADVLFFEAPTNLEQLQRLADAFDAPLLYNLAVGGRSPALSLEILRELGVAIVLRPIDALLAAAAGVRNRLELLRRSDDPSPPAMSFAELNERLGLREQLALLERSRG